jgi:acyl transferase domain-containing protein
LFGILELADSAISQFFSTTAHEAAAMDPQQRILLEVSYEAFENGKRDSPRCLVQLTDETLIAGIPMESLPGSSTAVYCGSFVKGLYHVRGAIIHEVNHDLDYEQIVLRDPDDSVSS